MQNAAAGDLNLTEDDAHCSVVHMRLLSILNNPIMICSAMFLTSTAALQTLHYLCLIWCCWMCNISFCKPVWFVHDCSASPHIEHAQYAYTYQPTALYASS